MKGLNSRIHNFQEEHAERMRSFRESHATAVSEVASRHDALNDHNQLMRTLRRSHIVLETNTVRVDKHDLQGDLPTIHVSHFLQVIQETGGTTGTVDWSSLIPMWTVVSNRFSQN